MRSKLINKPFHLFTELDCHASEIADSKADKWFEMFTWMTSNRQSFLALDALREWLRSRNHRKWLLLLLLLCRQVAARQGPPVPTLSTGAKQPKVPQTAVSSQWVGEADTAHQFPNLHISSLYFNITRERKSRFILPIRLWINTFCKKAVLTACWFSV